MSTESLSPRPNRFNHVVQELRDLHHCPNCRTEFTGRRCRSCGVDLASDAAWRLADASEAAALALEARQEALTALLATRVSVQAPASAPAVDPPLTQGPGTTVAGPPRSLADPFAAPPAAAATRPGREVNQVAVFSAVGVGALVAAAMVFAWLVPLDPAAVRVVLLGVTGLALAATLWLRHRRPVSAAAIATGVVALGLLDVNLFSGLGSNRWLLSAAAVGALAIALGAAGLWLRLRPWVSAAVLLAPVAVLLVVPGLGRGLLSTEGYWQAAGVLVAAAAVAATGRPAAALWRADGDDRPLAVEQGILRFFAAVVLAGVTAMVVLSLGGRDAWGGLVLVGCAIACLLHSRAGADGWRTAAGVGLTLAAPAAMVGLGVEDASLIAAAWATWLALAALSLVPVLRRRGDLVGLLRGGFWTALVLVVPAVRIVAGLAFESLLAVAWGVPSTSEPLVVDPPAPHAAWAVVAVLLAAGGLLAASLLPAPDPGGRLVFVGGSLWAWFAVAAGVGAVLLPVHSATAQVWLLLALGAGCGGAVWLTSRGESKPPAPTLAALDLGGRLVLVLAVTLSWADRPLTLAVGAVAVVLAVAWRPAANRLLRPAAVAVPYAYALVLVGCALWWFPPVGTPADWFMVAGLVAVVASVAAMAIAVLDRVPAAYWFSVLGVSCVPWAFSIGLDLVERTWWTGAAATSLLAVEALVFTTGRRVVPGWLRVGVALTFLPTICVVVINAGAMLIPGSGSPYLLPVTATAAALIAVAAAPWSRSLTGRGMDAGLAREIRLALEVSALVTAVITVLLSLARAATGPGTTLVVCAILGVGAAVVALQPDRHRVWWLAALAFSGVLWSALVLAEVSVVEWYTLPVALAGVVTGIVLLLRDRTWWPLPLTGLQLALLPTLVLALTGRDVVARSLALAVTALAVSVAAGWLHRRAATPPPLLAIAGSGIAVAGIAPVVLSAWAARFLFDGPSGSGNEGLARIVAGLAGSPDAVFFAVVGVSAAAVVFYGWAGQVVHWATAGTPRHRLTASWRFAPALLVAAAVLVITIWLGAPAPPSLTDFTPPAFGWPVVWTLWLACLGLLALALWSTVLRLRDRLVLPPAWLCWVAAAGVGVAGWSLRLLRVEFHALPLGLVLFACGLLVWRASVHDPDRHQAKSWPNGFTEPSHLLVPGTLATLAPSTLAILTDPQTWRAILVLVLALGFLLLGARSLWRPVMVTGIADLGLAIVLVFVARRGSIDWVPWLIALVGAGGMLLGLGIYAERLQSVGGGRLSASSRPPEKEPE